MSSSSESHGTHDFNAVTPPINSVSDEEILDVAKAIDAEAFREDFPVLGALHYRTRQTIAKEKASRVIEAIAARRAANTPVDGWVMVPKEPTGDMIVAGRMADDAEDFFSSKIIYQAMLAASPASPALPSQVGVKPLPWKENGASSIWTGELQFGVYYTIYVESAGWRVFRHQFLSEASETEIAFVSSLASAKAAAQANFDQAIQSCLTSPAAEPVEAVELMVTELLDISKVADPQMRKRAAFMLMRLYTHPAPSASREVTEADIERAAEAMWRAEVQDIGAARRAREAEYWADQSEDTRGKWLRFACAALTLPERGM